MYYRTGDKVKEQAHYQKAAELELENPTFVKNLAYFYYVELGRAEEAVELYVRALASNPTNIETLSAMGHICTALQKFDDAKVYYNRILELDPRNPDARQNLY